MGAHQNNKCSIFVHAIVYQYRSPCVVTASGFPQVDGSCYIQYNPSIASPSLFVE